MSKLLLWLGDFTNLLFVNRPEHLLTFVGVGMAMILYALSQTAGLHIESKKTNKEVLDEHKHLDPDERKVLNARRHYWKFLSFVEKIGIGYFLSACFLVILITYTDPVPIPAPPGYKLLSNLSFFTLLVPTLTITCYYIYYRFVIFRIH